MTMKMKALKTFLGRAGESEGRDNIVKRASEFTVDSETRAKELEKLGLAQRLHGRPAARTAPAAKRNAASGAGPLRSAGGKTGAAGSQSSSLPGLQPATRKRRSRKPHVDAGAGGQD